MEAGFAAAQTDNGRRSAGSAALLARLDLARMASTCILLRLAALAGGWSRQARTRYVAAAAGAVGPADGDGGLSVGLKCTLELPLPQHQEDRIVDRLFGVGRQPPTKSMATTSS